MDTFIRETSRLRLRSWEPKDLVPFSEMNADPVVMTHFPDVISHEESKAMMERCIQHWEAHGFGIAVVESKTTSEFLGTAGLMHPRFDSFFTPCVEIGWRFVAAHWNQGYATEAAQELLRFGFEDLKLPEIVSMTSLGNLPSRRVMEKLGMTYQRDFDHPSIPKHRLTRHALYTMPSTQCPHPNRPTHMSSG